MACNCGKKGGSSVEYVATFSDGSTRTYASEHEARAATKSKGGTYYARSKK